MEEQNFKELLRSTLEKTKNELSNSPFEHNRYKTEHPVTGEYFYWEHFGMMDKPDYARSTIDKLNSYVEHGIIPSVNLITTYETADHPITQLKIANVVKEYFLSE